MKETVLILIPFAFVLLAVKRFPLNINFIEEDKYKFAAYIINTVVIYTLGLASIILLIMVIGTTQSS
jgi:uncharacterized membrane protein YqjE